MSHEKNHQNPSIVRYPHDRPAFSQGLLQVAHPKAQVRSRQAWRWCFTSTGSKFENTSDHSDHFFKSIMNMIESSRTLGFILCKKSLEHVVWWLYDSNFEGDGSRLPVLIWVPLRKRQAKVRRRFYYSLYLKTSNWQPTAQKSGLDKLSHNSSHIHQLLYLLFQVI